MEKILHISIDLDQLVKDLENIRVSEMETQALCELGLKVRIAAIILQQQPLITARHQQTNEIIRSYDQILTDEMQRRGLQIVDSAELVDADPEDIAEALVDMDFSALIEWAEALKETAQENKQDADMLVHVNNEIMRRSLEMSGGMLS